jgi:pyruvate dehydrogenase E2 component (dihydrolipoamide acetyltransferase)
MMPAMSPLMTEGTITRWKKKEGEAFAAGDVLLQIESDVAMIMIDVEAHTPGILGKILMPDGTSGVPVEQVIALVARDMDELALIQKQGNVPTPPPFNPIPAPPSASLVSPRHHEHFNPLSSPRTPSFSPRTPSLFEMHTMGYGHRSTHVGGPRGAPLTPRLDAMTQDASSSYGVDVPPCPSPSIRLQQLQELPIPQTPLTAKWPSSAVDNNEDIDGAAIRRMIVSNLSSKQESKNLEFDDLL